MPIAGRGRSAMRAIPARWPGSGSTTPTAWAPRGTRCSTRGSSRSTRTPACGTSSRGRPSASRNRVWSGSDRNRSSTGGWRAAVSLRSSSWRSETRAPRSGMSTGRRRCTSCTTWTAGSDMMTRASPFRMMQWRARRARGTSPSGRRRSAMCAFSRSGSSTCNSRATCPCRWRAGRSTCSTYCPTSGWRCALRRTPSFTSTPMTRRGVRRSRCF